MSLAPRRLGPYEVFEQLGAGGMGEVWLARDSRLEREVALKVLPARLVRDREALALFRNEALALATLNHPNIATIHGLEELPGGTLVLVLERVLGESLAARLGRGPLAVQEALQIAAQIAQALEIAHEHGIVHRDLKPANVMIGPRGLVKVLDFGLAKRTHGLADVPQSLRPPDAAGLEGSLAGLPIATAWPAGEAAAISPATLTGPLAGTPGYMSPEQVLTGTQDPRTDVFAFGCVLYECLTGRRAFPADDPYVAMAQVLGESPDPGALPERLPPAVAALLAACLAKEAGARPRDMRVIRHTLEETLGIRRAAALREDGGAPSHNLPAPATSFVGREATLGHGSRALAASRLLTLVGIGGSGKTRLALRLAEIQLGAFPDGAWLVDVAPLSDPGRLAETLATALGVRDEAGRTPLEGVLAWLGPRRALVLLDNCETHREACAGLAREILRAAADVKLIATSREPLEVPGEATFIVPTLDVPGTEVRSAAAAMTSEAVQLFCARARASSPAFELDDANAPAVAEICRRLDGIPLALELAAARIRMLPPEQIRARLDDRFKLLTRGATSAPSRQQTVLAVIQWSWDHLLPPEQELLTRLAVFTGGWTLDRAVEVCSESGDEFEMLDLLTRLAERSLVVPQQADGGAVRYRFLESVWRFALDKLTAHPQLAELRERHLATYETLAERSEKALAGAGLPEALREMEPEQENLLAALAWSAQARDGVQRGLRLAAAAHRFWSVRGRFALGRRALEEALGRDHERLPTPARAVALTRAAALAQVMGDYDASRPLLEESLESSRRSGNRKGIARALTGLCITHMWQARYEEAHTLCGESLAIYRELGEPSGIAKSLYNLGTIEWAMGRSDFGRDSLEAALAVLEVASDPRTKILCLSALAASLSNLGELDDARQRIVQGLALMETVDLPREAIALFDALADYLLARGQPPESARALGAAENARLNLEVSLMPQERVWIDRLRANLIAALGREETEREIATGRGLTRTQALAEAKTLLNDVHLD